MSELTRTSVSNGQLATSSTSGQVQENPIANLSVLQKSSESFKNDGFHPSSSESDLNDDEDDEFNPSSGRKSKKRSRARRRHSIAVVPAQKVLPAEEGQEKLGNVLNKSSDEGQAKPSAVLSSLAQAARRPRSNSLNVKPAKAQSSTAPKTQRPTLLSTSTGSPMKHPMLFNPSSSKGSAVILHGNTTLQKPSYSYASLIGLSIMNSEGHRARLSSIYQWITSNFLYYKMDHGGWQNSIRHNLTVNKCFVKDMRKADPPGKGSFWTIHEEYKQFFETGLIVDGGYFTCGNQKVSLRTGSVLPNSNNNSGDSGGNGSIEGSVLSPFSQIKRSSFSRRLSQSNGSESQRNNLTVRFGDFQEQDESFSSSSDSDSDHFSYGSDSESELENYDVPEYKPQMPDIKTPGSPFFSVFTKMNTTQSEKVRAISPPAFKPVFDDEMAMTSESLFEHYSKLSGNTPVLTTFDSKFLKPSSMMTIEIPADPSAMQLDDESPNISCLNSIVPSLMTSHEDLLKLREMQYHNVKQLHDVDLKVSFDTSQRCSPLLFSGTRDNVKTVPLFSGALPVSNMKNNITAEPPLNSPRKHQQWCELMMAADADFLRHSSLMNSTTCPEVSDLFYGIDSLEDS